MNINLRVYIYILQKYWQRGWERETVENSHCIGCCSRKKAYAFTKMSLAIHTPAPQASLRTHLWMPSLPPWNGQSLFPHLPVVWRRLEVHHGSPSWYRRPSRRWTQDVTKLSVGVFLRGWSGAPLTFFLWQKEQPGQSLGTSHRHNTSKKNK